MLLDISTLWVVAATNLFMVSAVLLPMVGRSASAATRCAQLAMASLMLGGVSAIAAAHVWTPVLAPLAIAYFGVGQWLLHRALGGWLGHHARPNKFRKKKPVRRGPQDWLEYRWSARCLLVLLVAGPVGYVLAYLADDRLQLPLVWSHTCLALMLLLVARATLFPLRKSDRAWRWLLCGAQVVMALVLLARALVALGDDADATQTMDLVLAITVNLAAVVLATTLLAAWRDEAKARLHSLAMTDGLTGLLNRRGWMERAEAMFANAQRYQQPMTLMMLDLDHFKRINDTHGHEAGDKTLKLFARLLRESRRTGDLVGRLGGEEFCIVLANTHRSASIGFDQRLRFVLDEVAETELGFRLNFSAGVAVLRDGDGTLAGCSAAPMRRCTTRNTRGAGGWCSRMGGLGRR